MTEEQKFILAELVLEDLAIIGQENQPIRIGLDLTMVDHQLVKVGETAFNLAVARSKHRKKVY
ncbi:hypothetical protein [Paenibacillus sp. Mc5Re-14]|uniref:hypothetical protein n=1 Tax=Paenibacillus sp. Mc5Re-14 TaxID=1030529 RepID=UPI000B12F89E|nr:hypothetical protein [Paenibacillus sp. Mc5Re-14]